jgi:hypothetical protein
MPDRIVKCDPQVQQAQPGNDAPHRAMGGKAPERGVVQKNWVLVPEKWPPRDNANCQPDIHAEQHAQEQFPALKPARNPLRLRPGRGRRARGQGGRCELRLLGHSLYTFGPLTRTNRGRLPQAVYTGLAWGRRTATVTQRAQAHPCAQLSVLSLKPGLPGIFQIEQYCMDNSSLSWFILQNVRSPGAQGTGVKVRRSGGISLRSAPGPRCLAELDRTDATLCAGKS